jgi:hypothetical protein
VELTDALSVMFETLVRWTASSTVWFPLKNTKVDPVMKYVVAFFVY